MVDRVFGSIAEAMSARRRGVLLYVRVGGVAVKATEAHITHTDDGIGQATVYLTLPAPAQLDYNATLEIEIGQPGTVRRRFYGFIPKWTRAISNRGRQVRVTAVGWLSYLNYADPGGTSITGPASLKDVFRSLCAGRGLPSPKSDETLYPNGDVIMLGGNEAVDGGDIRCGDDTSPHTFLQQVAPLFGYRVHDNPDAQPRMSRVSGIPIPLYTAGIPTYLYSVDDYGSATTTVNIRSGPGTSFPVVGAMGNGQLFRVLEGPTINSNPTANSHWYRVAALNGATGWSRLNNTAMLPLASSVTLTEPLYWFTEGVNLRDLTISNDRTPVVNYVEVTGKTYTELDGGKNTIRSIPQSVLPNPAIAPQTVVHRKFTSQWLTTSALAEGSRNAYEIDLGAPLEEFQWTAGGRGDVQIAEIGVLNSASYNVSNRTVWLTKIVDDVTDRAGWSQSYTGWYGGGQARPAGDDCVYKTIATGPIHVGNQNISWYAHAAPQSSLDDDDKMVWSISFTVEDTDYSSIRVEGEGHGSNSYNDHTQSEGSVIEIWQKPDPNAAESADNEWRRIGSVTLPTLNEESSKRRPYGTQDKWWTPFALPIGGTLKMGPARMKIFAGENPDGWDDFEVRNIRLKTCGVGQPVLPGAGS